MISVERVVEYTDLEKEAPWEYQKRPLPSWPHEGVIIFDNVNFSYSLDGPLVLKHLTALIKSKEKVCFSHFRLEQFTYEHLDPHLLLASWAVCPSEPGQALGNEA